MRGEADSETANGVVGGGAVVTRRGLGGHGALLT